MYGMTKQGVRNLNPAGYNGRRRAGRCSHFYGQLVAVGTRWEIDPDYFGEAFEVPVYGRRCMHCGDTREA